MDIITKSTYNFKNRSLNASTKRIMKAGITIGKSFYKIAAELARIDTKKLYIEDGFESTIDYAKRVVGLNQSNAYYLLKIGLEYTADGEHSIFVHDDGMDYTIGQWKYLLPLGKDAIGEMDKDGVIKPSMSVRAIANVVKMHTAAEPEETVETETDADEYEDIEPPIPVVVIADGELSFYKDAGVPLEKLRDYIDSLIATR